jgi:hypothetical protein
MSKVFLLMPALIDAPPAFCFAGAVAVAVLLGRLFFLLWEAEEGNAAAAEDDDETDAESDNGGGGRWLMGGHWTCSITYTSFVVEQGGVFQVTVFFHPFLPFATQFLGGLPTF